MENNLDDEIKKESNESLKNIIINFNIHRGALVAAAKKELEYRGLELSETEQELIENKKKSRIDQAIKNTDNNNNWTLFNAKFKKNIVDDINAPQLYSRQVINSFSIIFTVLFGGILLAINLKNINNKKAIYPVLIFSFAYTSIMIYVLNMLPKRNSLFTLILNSIGSIVLYHYFWSKYIGHDFKYRTKPFWIPLIIGLIISGFFIWAMLIGN